MNNGSNFEQYLEEIKGDVEQYLRSKQIFINKQPLFYKSPKGDRLGIIITVLPCSFLDWSKDNGTNLPEEKTESTKIGTAKISIFHSDLKGDSFEKDDILELLNLFSNNDTNPKARILVAEKKLEDGRSVVMADVYFNYIIP